MPQRQDNSGSPVRSNRSRERSAEDRKAINRWIRHRRWRTDGRKFRLPDREFAVGGDFEHQQPGFGHGMCLAYSNFSSREANETSLLSSRSHFYL